MDRQTTRQHAVWAAPLAWLRGRVTASGRGVVLGALAVAGAVVAPLALLVIAVPGAGFPYASSPGSPGG